MQGVNLKIALLHHTGGGNLGDEASVDTVLSNLRRRWPDSTISLLSMNPSETARVHGIPSYALRTYIWELGSGADSKTTKPTSKFRLIRWLQSTRSPVMRIPRRIWQELAFLVKSFQIVRRFDFLIVSGGGQLTGKSGPWGFPYAILLWFLMAKLAGTRCIFLNVGAGPLTDRLSKFFVICTLRAASYVSFRDEPSQKLTRSIGFRGPSDVFPDNVYGFDLASPAILGSRRTSGRTVGIAPLAYPARPACSTAEQKTKYDEVITSFAKFTSSISQESYSLSFFGTDIEEDAATIEDVRKVLRDRYKLATPLYKPIRSVAELLSRLAMMDYIVTCRFHAVVFAHLLNKPVIAISPHPKVSDHMNALGMSKYCTDIQSFDANALMMIFHAAVREQAEIKDRMAVKLAEYRFLLKTQWDNLFPRDCEHSLDRQFCNSQSFTGETES
jgi:polysaccharide pyruvyl transferase WcaK-like protein